MSAPSDQWFATWHWLVAAKDSTPDWMGPAIGGVTLALVAAVGGYVARRLDDRRSRRAAILTEHLGAVDDALTAGATPPDLERMVHRLHRHAVACSRHDTKHTLPIVIHAGELVAAQRNVAEARRGYDEEKFARWAEVPTDDPDFGDRYSEISQELDRRYAWEPLADAAKAQAAMLDAIRSYQSWLDRRLYRFW